MTEPATAGAGRSTTGGRPLSRGGLRFPISSCSTNYKANIHICRISHVLLAAPALFGFEQEAKTSLRPK